MLNYKSIIKFLISGILIFACLISCEEAFFESELSEEEVTVLLPENNSKVFDEKVRFEWLSVPSATRYQIQLASPNFEKSDFLVFDRIVDTIFVIDSLRQIGNYEWRVRGLSNNGTTPYKTSKIELIKNPGIEFQRVDLISPTNNQLSNALKNTLEWKALEGATEYEIQILNSSSEVIITEKTESTNIELEFPEGASVWQVRAINNGKNTAFSKNNIVIDTKIPQKPVLMAPANASMVAVADLEFTWNRTLVEGTKEKDSIYIFTDEAQTDLKLKEEVSSPFKTNLEVGTYFWKIQAFDEAGNVGEESDAFSVTVN